MAKTGLVTVPTFIFEQGDVFTGEGNAEYPIQVCYYNGYIEITQNGNSIILLNDKRKNFFREVNGHLPEAKGWHDRKSITQQKNICNGNKAIGSTHSEE